MENPQREIVIITGKTGYGKSTWLALYCSGKRRIFAFDPFRKFPATYLTEEEILAGVNRGDFEQGKEFAVASHNLPDLELIGALSFLCGDCLLVIEECGFVWRKGEGIPEWLREIVLLGRHKNVSLAVTAQAPIFIPIDLRSQAHRFVSFRVTEQRDIDWTQQYLGERVAEISELPRYECLDAEEDIVNRYKVRPNEQLT